MRETTSLDVTLTTTEVICGSRSDGNYMKKLNMTFWHPHHAQAYQLCVINVGRPFDVKEKKVSSYGLKLIKSTRQINKVRKYSPASQDSKIKFQQFNKK